MGFPNPFDWLPQLSPDGTLVPAFSLRQQPGGALPFPFGGLPGLNMAQAGAWNPMIADEGVAR